MQREGIPSDRVILSCILKACGNNYSKEYGRILHDSVSRNGWASDTVVGSSLIDMYVNFGNLEEALWVFHSLPHKNIVSWGALMEGYVQQEDGIGALFLFEKMLHEGIELDNMIFICVSKACAITESIFQGKIIHSHIVYNGLDADVSIASSLVDMYVKCGNVYEACKVFDCIEDPDIISWGSVVTAYALVGNHKMVRKGLDVILQNGIQLDAVIFTTILTACGHEGLVEEGLYYFKYMRAFQEFQPNIEHYNCIIDLLSRAGRLYDANAILATIPIRTNITGWICLLASCKIYGDTELASRCLDHMVMLKHSGCSVGVMSLAISDPSLRKHTQQTSIDVNYYMYDFRVAENAIDMTSTIGDHPLPIVCDSSP
jgi:pentatricopeptide repeat protein